MPAQLRRKADSDHVVGVCIDTVCRAPKFSGSVVGDCMLQWAIIGVYMVEWNGVETVHVIVHQPTGRKRKMPKATLSPKSGGWRTTTMMARPRYIFQLEVMSFCTLSGRVPDTFPPSP